MGQLSISGICWKGHVPVVELGPCTTATIEEWMGAINNAKGQSLVVYMNGSMDQEGQMGGR